MNRTTMFHSCMPKKNPVLQFRIDQIIPYLIFLSFVLFLSVGWILLDSIGGNGVHSLTLFHSGLEVPGQRMAIFVLMSFFLWWEILHHHFLSDTTHSSDPAFWTEWLKFCVYQITVWLSLLDGFSPALGGLIVLSILEILLHWRWISNQRVSLVIAHVSPWLATGILVLNAPAWPLAPLLVGAHCFTLAAIPTKKSLGIGIADFAILTLLLHWVSFVPLQCVPLGMMVVCLSFLGVKSLYDSKRPSLKLEQPSFQELLEPQFFCMLKIETIAQLTRGIAHAFNNLLTGILGNLQLAKLRKNTDVTMYLENAIQATNHTADLMQKLFQYSRKYKTEKIDMDIRLILEEIQSLFSHSLDHHTQLQIEYSPESLSLEVDPARVTTALLSLLFYSSHLIDEDSKEQPGKSFFIQIHVEPVRREIRECRNTPGAHPGQYALITITNNGKGMDEQATNQLFVPFSLDPSMEHVSGHLASTYSIIRQHQGWIEVESGLDTETAFRVYLPLQA